MLSSIAFSYIFLASSILPDDLYAIPNATFSDISNPVLSGISFLHSYINSKYSISGFVYLHSFLYRHAKFSFAFIVSFAYSQNISSLIFTASSNILSACLKSLRTKL